MLNNRVETLLRNDDDDDDDEGASPTVDDSLGISAPDRASSYPSLSFLTWSDAQCLKHVSWACARVALTARIPSLTHL